jgi:hypothetical protein
VGRWLGVRSLSRRTRCVIVVPSRRTQGNSGFSDTKIPCEQWSDNCYGHPSCEGDSSRPTLQISWRRRIHCGGVQEPIPVGLQVRSAIDGPCSSSCSSRS